VTFKPLLYSQGYKPREIDALTMAEIVEIADAWHWAQEQPGSHAWLLAHLLVAFGSEFPWTARAVLGRPLETHG
jgi:hypothetical protein